MTNEEKKSVTCLENLSNELFYEIYDYLDSYHVFNAFSNLNIHFQQLLNNPVFLLKICCYRTTENNFERFCREVIIPNQQRIRSLCLRDQVLVDLFCTLCTINQSYSHLQSVILIDIKQSQLLRLLDNFTLLPNLFSLDIHLVRDDADLATVYKRIFKLSHLTYVKISTEATRIRTLSRIATSEQICAIKYLNIDYTCIINDLAVLLSCTPHIRRLTCKRLLSSYTLFPYALSNLRNISINNCHLNFDIFENFIKQICSKLEVLNIVNTTDDVTYLDANRWERLISRYISHLRRFNFQFRRQLLFENTLSPYDTQINQFTSSFWTQRQWVFELEIKALRSTGVRMQYSIYSDRRKSIAFCGLENMTDDSFIPLIVTNVATTVDRINPILSCTEFTHLSIDYRKIERSMAMQFIHCLPNITSLIITPVPVQHIRTWISCSPKSFILDLRNNKLINMKIRLITDIEQALFFICNAPYIQHLEIECSNNIDVKTLVQNTIIKNEDYISSSLRSLCLYVGEINDEIITKLRQVMANKDFISNYTITCVYDRIHLQWKRMDL